MENAAWVLSRRDRLDRSRIVSLNDHWLGVVVVSERTHPWNLSTDRETEWGDLCSLMTWLVLERCECCIWRELLMRHLISKSKFNLR